ncbi:MAG: COX15/CtaA family protein [Anaerolineales bacterium]
MTLALALITAVLLLGLIVLGALVRGTDAEQACNETWFACNGRLIPPDGDPRAWLDWGHRALALLVGLFSISTWLAARRYFDHRPDIRQPAYLGLGLLGGQIVLGAGSMGDGWLSTLPMLHLALAIIMLSCMVAVVMRIGYQPPPRWFAQRETFSTAVHGVTLMTFLVVITGTLVVGSGASASCTNNPLCMSTADDASIIHLVHRLTVLLLGILIGMLWWRAGHERTAEKETRYTIASLAVLFSVQVVVGALYALSGGHLLLSAVHVLLAVLTWSVAVGLSMVMLIQDRMHIDHLHLELE